ncbi:MAG: hypothetical protein Q8L07_13810 [Sediminibacterium sp.]|nr:hypothetical protein [Sediminibacterium sp.]MDP1809762.1 hypothetical protein [Sediminibacterium sp.]MDP3129390.1 hypothetical protein [Sediminibacterium sp.]MDP3666840.1 hypothetical protein [Sediminibacterium sp.]
MKTLFILAGMIILTACQKENNQRLPAVSRTIFFKNNADASRKIQTVLDQRSLGEKLERIESVSYIDSKDKSYAFVFYTSNKGSGNVILQQQYLNGQALALSSVTCSGTNCNCQVKTIISNSGSVTLDCSCSSCTMLINTVAGPGYH